MSDKPRVYGFCPAGCKWEVPHKDELNEVLEISNSALTKANEALTNETGALETANTALSNANNAKQAADEAKAMSVNNSLRYSNTSFDDTPYVYGSANPGNIGFKLPSSFDSFKNGTLPLGWSGELEIVYTIQNSEEEYKLSIPFTGFWYKRSVLASPFGGNTIWTSYGNFVTPDEHTYSHTVTSTMDYYSSEPFTIYFELNLDNNGWVWLSNLKIKYKPSTTLEDLNYTGLTIEVKNINFFK